MKSFKIMLSASLVAIASVGAAQADKLTLYCSAQEDWCQLMANNFQDATGIKVAMTRKSSGETFAQIKAEVLILKVTYGGVVLGIHIFKLLKKD